MKRIRHFLPRLLAVTLLLAMIVGCTPVSAETNPPATTAPAKTQPQAATTSPTATDAPEETGYPLPLVDKPVTLDIMFEDHATFPLRSDCLVYGELQRRTGVTLNFLTYPQGVYSDKFNTTMASGNIPDLIKPPDTISVRKYGMQGAYLALEDIISQQMPNAVKLIDQYNGWGDLRAFDGHIYAFPQKGSSSYAQGLHVRGDWMEEYNLQMPETLDDLTALLMQFRDLDPAGNGATIPWGSHALQFYAIFEACGVRHQWVRTEDNMARFGPAMDGWAEALKFLANAYSEKLIDQEFMVISKAQWEAKVVSGEVGFITYDMTRSQVFTEMFQAADPNTTMKMVPIAPLIGPDGNRYARAGSQGLDGFSVCVGIKTPKEKVDVAAKLFDYMLSEDGRILGSYGIEGESFYYDANGEAQFMDIMYKDNNFNVMGMNYRQISGWSKEDYFVKSVKGTLNETAYLLQLPYQLPNLPTFAFSDEENDSITDIQTLLYDKRDEYFYKIVTGQDTLETSWDGYIAELKALGLDELESVYNAAYDRWKQK